MNLKTLPLSKQISFVSAGLVALIVLTLVGVTAWFTANEAIERTERNVSEQANGLKRSIETAFLLSEESSTRLSDLFESWFRGNLVMLPDQTFNVGGTELPRVYINSQAITGDYQLVDDFTETTGGIATVFAKVGDDYVRVSTSLKKEDGSRAVATKLDRNHPGFAAVSQGNTYIGEAVLFGKRYMTKYVPVKSTDGQQDLILFIGFDMTNLFGRIEETVLNTRVGESGVPYVLFTTGSRAGHVLIHPSLKGDAFVKMAETETGIARLLDRVKKQDAGVEQVTWRDPNTGATHEEFMAFSKTPLWNGAVVIAPAIKSEVFSTVYQMTTLMVVMGVLATILIAFALYWITSSLTSSTKVLTNLALKLGNGDMTARAQEDVTNGTVSTKNEISLLARSMNRMAESMEQALGAVKRSTHQVQEASEDLVHTSEELNKGAASGSDAASGMAAAVEEMSSSISSVGESAGEAKNVSNKARHLADEGYGAIHSATQQMHKISENVLGTAGVIKQLGEQSREISEIALIIKGIAEQTNLLALNAAIEAARAGEQGRGFSVVADEVRKLAERTRKSTDDIHGMIEAIQNSSGVAVNNMDMAVESVKKGVELVDRAGQAMNQINVDSSAVARSVEDIDAALIEQKQASESIGHQVEVVAQLSESNLDMARRAANAVSGLRGVATDLSNILKKFQVKD